MIDIRKVQDLKQKIEGMILMEDLILGVDVGNSETVVCGADGTFMMPSAMILNGPSACSVLSTRQQPDDYRYLEPGEYFVSFDGGFTEYAIGEMAFSLSDRYALETTRGNETRYYTSTDILMCTAIAAAYPKQASFSVRLITGVPVQYWTRQLADRIVQSWKRHHSFLFNGRQTDITVSDVVVVAEGHAAWQVLSDKQKQGNCLLLDIGGRTANALGISNGEVKAQITKELGVETVLDQLSSALAQQYRSLTPQERRGVLMAIKDNQPYSIVHNSTRVRIDTPARTLFETATKNLLNAIRREWDLSYLDTFVVVGGGVYYHGQFLAQCMLSGEPSVTLASTPEYLNAHGYYWYGSQEKPKSRKKGR